MQPVSIVIPSRTPWLVERCIASIQASIEWEHIVVSNDGPFNFSSMVNEGVGRARYPVVLLLNDDIVAVQPGWLEALSRRVCQPETPAAGAVLLYPNGDIQHAGVVIGGGKGPAHIGRGDPAASPLWPWLLCTREVSAVTAACMAVRREVYEEVGGFDTSFPVNYNDVDFCLRVRKAGYRVVLEAEAVLHHDESRTRRAGTSPEERKRFAERWPDVLAEADPYYSAMLMHGSERIRLW